MQQAKLMRSEHTLGRSPALVRLFDFLLECALEGGSPKEVEIADRVSARAGDGVEQTLPSASMFTASAGELDDFHAGPGGARRSRLV